MEVSHTSTASYVNLIRSHSVASSTAAIFYASGGAYTRVNCTNSDQTLSDCEHGLIEGFDPRNQCSTGQFAQVECNTTRVMLPRRRSTFDNL